MMTTSTRNPLQHLSRRELQMRALGTFLLTLGSAWLALDPAEILLLYALQLGFALLLTLPLALRAGHWLSLSPTPFRGVIALGLGVLLIWGMAVILPLVLGWFVRDLTLFAELSTWNAARWRSLFWPVLGMMVFAVFAGLYARTEDAAAISPALKRIAFERGLCHLAFVVIGPTLYSALLPIVAALEFESPSTLALIATFAVCEAYPYLAALRELRTPRAEHVSTSRRQERLNRKLQQLHARLKHHRHSK